MEIKGVTASGSTVLICTVDIGISRGGRAMISTSVDFEKPFAALEKYFPETQKAA